MNIWTKLFILALNNLKYGKLKLSINTDHHLISGKLPGPNADLIIENKDIIKKILIEGSVAFGEEYVNGNIKTSNLENLLSYFAVNNDEVEKNIKYNLLFKIKNKLNHYFNKNTKKGSKKNIHSHYDLGNNFYKIWLDKSMTYSSAIFKNETDDLQIAQKNKYNKLLKYKVIIKDIFPEALEMSKYIADDCGRKNGKSLNNGIAKKLIQVWCNKVLLLRYTYQTYKHQDKYTWIDFGMNLRKKDMIAINKINSNNILLPDNYIFITDRKEANFRGKCPISAQFIANLFMVDYKFLLEFTELFLKSFDEFSIYTQYFDEEIIIQYMYLMNYIKIIN